MQNPLIVEAHAQLGTGSFQDAVKLALNALQYPGITRDEEFALYLIIIEAYTAAREYALAEANVLQVQQVLPTHSGLRKQFYLDAARVFVALDKPLQALQFLDDYQFDGLPMESVFYSLSAAAQLRLRNYPDAAVSLQKCDSVEAQAQLFAVQNDVPGLEGAAEVLLQNDPNFTGLTQICANLAVMSGESQKALYYGQKCREFADIWGNFDGAELQRQVQFVVEGECAGPVEGIVGAFVLVSRREYLQALEHIQTLRGGSTHEKALLALSALCSAGLGDAPATMTKLDKVGTQTSFAMHVTGVCFRLLGNYGRAKRCFADALKTVPPRSLFRAEVLTSLGEVKWVTDDLQGAVRDLVAAKALVLANCGRGGFYGRVCALLGQIYDVLYVLSGNKVIRGEAVLVVEDAITGLEERGLAEGAVCRELRELRGRIRARR
ncbi:hypothetical protein SS50377_25860 [Spironucleus salmonicida]|uniref:Tetratricopeptide repeat-containing protein n=1 Tax=Spironucleus salmonicida TaxID=348837 RepID=A0A9P8RWF8_9EUKA|nr:hypothetical protein SS50377_25860 [Spironucleus salmonicida]